MDELIGRMERAVEALTSQRARVEAGEPWPLSARFGTEPEASWGPRETLAHVTEMLPFWLGEIERILAGPAEPVPFGRWRGTAASRSGNCSRAWRGTPGDLRAGSASFRRRRRSERGSTRRSAS
jgi:hypothetical protein